MKVEITLNKQKIIFLASIFLLVLFVIIVYPHIPFPIYSTNFFGTKMGFRANLRDAKNVPVYPSEELVYREIMNQLVENITIAFKPGEKINAQYAVETFEIVNKLAIAYKKKFGYIPNFNVINVTSYENLFGEAQNPIIALVHPIYSNETSVRLDNHIIYIQGKGAESLKDQLKNFDLAVVKFLMVTLGIEI